MLMRNLLLMKNRDHYNKPYTKCPESIMSTPWANTYTCLSVCACLDTYMVFHSVIIRNQGMPNLLSIINDKHVCNIQRMDRTHTYREQTINAGIRQDGKQSC